MKVGNSLAMNLPKPVVDVYSIKKGDSVRLTVTDNGIYIPLVAKKEMKNKNQKRKNFSKRSIC